MAPVSLENYYPEVRVAIACQNLALHITLSSRYPFPDLVRSGINKKGFGRFNNTKTFIIVPFCCIRDYSSWLGQRTLTLTILCAGTKRGIGARKDRSVINGRRERTLTKDSLRRQRFCVAKGLLSSVLQVCRFVDNPKNGSGRNSSKYIFGAALILFLLCEATLKVSVKLCWRFTKKLSEVMKFGLQVNWCWNVGIILWKYIQSFQMATSQFWENWSYYLPLNQMQTYSHLSRLFWAVCYCVSL